MKRIFLNNALLNGSTYQYRVLRISFNRINTMTWQKYINTDLDAVTLNGLLVLESEIGFKFPDDVRTLIIKHQGQVPDKMMIESDELTPVQFGPVLHASKNKSDINSIRYAFNKWSEFYKNLVPIARSGQSGCVFALDYRTNSANPAVVFIDANTDPEDQDSVLFVANNITELLNNLSGPE